MHIFDYSYLKDKLLPAGCRKRLQDSGRNVRLACPVPSL